MENDNDFYYHINEINKRNDRSGNKAIYFACKGKGSTLLDAVNLEYFEGMMWLIGRSYAASPQRRSYGKSQKMKKDDSGNSRAVWPVKTENSGNGDFFAALAKNIVMPTDSRSKEDLNNLKVCLKQLASVENDEYRFEHAHGTDNPDYNRLSTVIKSVCLLNRLVKRASEKFDGVPSENIHKIPKDYSLSGIDEEEYVYCKNQISFCSKFLHFFFPNSVFIIDQFSEKGGKFLFPRSKKGLNDKRYISFEYVDEKNPFESEIFYIKDKSEEFYKNSKERNAFIDSLREKLKAEAKIDNKEIQRLKESGVKFKKDETDVETALAAENKSGNEDSARGYFDRYLVHCVNSYYLCMNIKEKIKEPKVSFPRLSDSVFMRIKEASAAKNDDKTSELNNIYYHK